MLHRCLGCRWFLAEGVEWNVRTFFMGNKRKTDENYGRSHFSLLEHLKKKKVTYLPYLSWTGHKEFTPCFLMDGTQVFYLVKWCCLLFFFLINMNFIFVCLCAFSRWFRLFLWPGHMHDFRWVLLIPFVDFPVNQRTWEWVLTEHIVEPSWLHWKWLASPSLCSNWTRPSKIVWVCLVSHFPRFTMCTAEPWWISGSFMRCLNLQVFTFHSLCVQN